MPAETDLAVLQRRIVALERILVLREAQLRQARNGIIEAADLEIDQFARQVRRGGEVLDLKPKEYQLIALLARHLGELVPINEVHKRLYGREERPKSNSLAVHLARLRKALDGGEVSIETKRRVGLRLLVIDPAE